MITTSERVAMLPTYAVAEIAERKRRLIAEGVDVIDLGAGDADLSPPDVAVEALCRAPRWRPGATERSDAVLAFLAEYPGEEFAVAGPDRALAAAGFDLGRSVTATAGVGYHSAGGVSDAETLTPN